MAVGEERICEQCQGRCCQGHPGVYTQPERFWRLFAEQEQPSLKLLELHAPRWHLQVRYVRNVVACAFSPKTAQRFLRVFGRFGLSITLPFTSGPVFGFATPL